MILIRLFLIFLKIGALTFGGGYAMISLIREDALAQGWLTEEELLNFIAVAETTPGPIAVNMATFVGQSQAGLLGALVATLGVVLPSFIIILIISAILKNLLQYKGVKAFISGLKPAIVGLIIGTAITMLLSIIFEIKNLNSTFKFEYKGAIILAIIICLSLLYSKLRKKKLSPIILILLSGILGVLFYL